MILADTSAWVELERATGSPIDARMTQLLERGAPPAVTEPVVMELLATRRPGRDVARIRRHLLAYRMLPVGGLHTWEHAAVIQRACRAQGDQVRSMIDCVIAAVAIREGVPVLHADRDFDVIARHTPLQIYDGT